MPARRDDDRVDAAGAAPVGVVAALGRHPVVGMPGEAVGTAVLGPGGVLGDGGFAVVDAADGRPLDPTAGGRLDLRAAYTADPEPGRPLPPANVHLPDGSFLRTDDERLHTALSDVLGVAVRLVPVTDAPAAGEPTVLLHHRATLAERGGLGDDGYADPRRHRFSVVVDGPSAGAEPGWAGRALRLGREVVLRPVPDRTGPDHPIPDGAVPDDAGVGTTATVASPGTVRVGDEVNLG